MSTPTFFRGVLVAGALAAVAAAGFATLVPFVGFGSVVRLGLPVISFAYILYLLKASNERTGNIATLSLWSALAIATWWVAPPLPFYVLIHAAAIWLVRSLYYYAGAIPSLMDLGLSALSICGFVWALTRTGSVFLATWSFFLVQALFVVIPPAIGRQAETPNADNGTFDRARRQADEALRALASQ